MNWFLIAVWALLVLNVLMFIVNLFSGAPLWAAVSALGVLACVYALKVEYSNT